jgi:hypothetical protein
MTSPQAPTRRFSAADRAAVAALLREAGDVLGRDPRVLHHPEARAKTIGYVGALLDELAAALGQGQPVAHRTPRLRAHVDAWAAVPMTPPQVPAGLAARAARWVAATLAGRAILASTDPEGHSLAYDLAELAGPNVGQEVGELLAGLAGEQPAKS